MELSEGEWREKIDFFKKSLSPCQLCPRRCGARRNEKEKGFCNAAGQVKIASFNLHFGEEPPISGTNGSGTVFFAGCPLKCVFCQNYPISHLANGQFYTIDGLADIFLHLQKRGAHNINLVSPTPYYFHIVAALYRACRRGLKIPIVNNTGGYERREVIGMLKGVVDVYLPDFKYDTVEIARRFSGAADYRQYAVSAIEEMVAQVGELVTDSSGIARKGVIIRHLILPGCTKNSRRVLKSMAASTFRHINLSLMAQYFPAYKAAGTSIDRRLTPEEYTEVKEYALSLNLDNGWFQDLE